MTRFLWLLFALPAFGQEGAVENPRFHAGDDLAWAQPEFDDSGWERVELPHRFPTGVNHGWYRMEVRLSESQQLQAFSPGYPGNICEVFWNGVKIGAKGEIETTIDLPLTSSYEVFPVRGAPIYIDLPNIVAVRVMRYQRAGGLLLEPPAAGSIVALSGRKAQLEQGPLIVLMIQGAVILLITLGSLVIALWRKSEAASWAFFVLMLTQLIFESGRVSVIFGHGGWLNLFTLMLIFYVYAIIGAVAGLFVVTSILEERQRHRWLRNSYLAMLGSGLIAVFISPIPSLAPLVESIFALVVIGFAIVAAIICIRALRRRRPHARVLTTGIAIAALFGVLGALDYLFPIFPVTRYWFDPSTPAMIVASAILGGVLISRLVKIKLHAQRLASQVLTAEIDERARVARELHDGVAQTLLAYRLQAEASVGDKEELQQLLDGFEQASDEVREASYELHPSTFGSRTLEESFQIHTMRLGADLVELTIEPAAAEAQPSAEKRHHLFRVFQELLGNALRHGKGSRVAVNWKRASSDFVLEITNSANAENDSQPDGLGSVSLEERVAILGGRLIRDRSDGRFIARVEIPIEIWQ